MASSRSRQRKLARDKYERQMVRRAQKQRRRRQVQAGIGAFVALALITVGSAWLVGAFDPEPEPVAESDLCRWIPQDLSANPDRIDVGEPPNSNPPAFGTRTMTVDLDAGEAGAAAVEVVLDVGLAPCAAASFEYLASQSFYADTTCHELFEGVALRCGDPSGSGLGGPAYAYFAENVPTPPAPTTSATPEPTAGGSATPDPSGSAGPEPTASPSGAADGEPLYPRGTVAVGDSTGQQGSQFLLFYEDYSPPGSPLYSIVGTVTGGLDLLDAIGDAGVEQEDGTQVPADEVLIKTLTVVDPTAPISPAATATPTGTRGPDNPA